MIPGQTAAGFFAFLRKDGLLNVLAKCFGKALEILRLVVWLSKNIAIGEHRHCRDQMELSCHIRIAPC